jgi:hypothetical protein
MGYRPERSEFSRARCACKDGWHHPDDSSVNREGDAKRLSSQPVRRQRARASPPRTIAVFLLAKFVASTRCHCTVRLESVAKTTICPSKNANTTIEPSSERPSHPALAVQIKSRLADGARS